MPLATTARAAASAVELTPAVSSRLFGRPLRAEYIYNSPMSPFPRPPLSSLLDPCVADSLPPWLPTGSRLVVADTPAVRGRRGGGLCWSTTVAGAHLVSGRVAIARWGCPARVRHQKMRQDASLPKRSD